MSAILSPGVTVTADGTRQYPIGTIALFKRQMDFVRDQRKWLLATGGIGSGKSTTAMAKAVARVAMGPGLGMIVAPIFATLRDATLRTFYALLDQAGLAFTVNKSDHLITILATGHEVIYRSAETPDNLRGPDVDWVAADELPYFTNAAFQVLRGRVRRPNTQLWGAGTPKGRNFVWQWWVQDGRNADGSAKANRGFYRFRTDENPTLDEHFIKDLGFTGAYAAQEIGGEFVAFEGLVFPMFDRERHIHPRTLKELHGWGCVIGGDVGASHPTAIVTRRQAGDGRVHLQREFYVRHLSSTDIVEAFVAQYQLAIAEGCRPDNLWIDPSAAGYIRDLERRGIRLKKADNDRMRGVQVCQAAIGPANQPVRFTVDPTCINFVSEIETYHYPDGDGTRDDPVKEHDHLMDAWRYAEMGAATPRRRGFLTA